MTTQYFFILGADDPEMSAVEQLLADCEQQYTYAESAPGVRVHAGNAYQYEARAARRGLTPVFVECGADPLPPGSIRVDHHREGDPGWGKPVSAYWEASSLGQVCRLLHKCGALSASYLRIYQSWWAHGGNFGQQLLDFGPGWNLWATPELCVIAAADHCLAAAYRGECPGVRPDEVYEFRLRTRAGFQGRTREAIEADIRGAQAELAAAPRIVIGGVEVADMRGRHVPELVEAGMLSRTPYMASPLSRDGERQKVVVSGPPALIAAFRPWAESQGWEVYLASPEREMGGAYLP